jgi:SAM-dependent methyltransferase
MKKHHQSRSVWIRDDRPVTPEEVAWLKTPAAQAVCAAMMEDEPADTPAAIERWRERLEPEQVAAAWNQVLLRRAGRAKFSRADGMLFDRVGLEQASDEVVAAHKAGRFSDCGRVADLCCGIGGDTLALAARAEVTAVDWSRSRVLMAEHNAAVYGGRIVGKVGDVLIQRPDADAIHIDPDRRPKGARRHDPVLASPDLEEIQRLVEHYHHAAIKLSPGADLSLLPFDAEIELISHRGECKQAVIWTGRFKQVDRRATVLPGGESVVSSEADLPQWPEPRALRPGCFLYEPDAAVIRADLVGAVARRFELAPVDRRIAYLLGDRSVSSSLVTPFQVIDVTDFSARKTRVWLATHDIGRVEIKTRGFASRPEELLRHFRLRGRHEAVLFLTRVAGRPIAILAERLHR